MFDIPERFNKNALAVRALGSQAQTGAWLIEYMCERIGIPDLSNSDVLDLGCGCRFTDAFLNLNVPVRSYTGVDVDAELMAYFHDNLADERLAFARWDVRNPMYNPEGEALTQSTRLPIGDQTFDILCMFSVITHQLPEDSAAIFSILRRHVRPDGRLFFSATITEGQGDYVELDGGTTWHSGYSMSAMTSLLERAGWSIVSFEPKHPQGRALPHQDTFLCAPI